MNLSQITKVSLFKSPDLKKKVNKNLKKKKEKHILCFLNPSTLIKFKLCYWLPAAVLSTLHSFSQQIL